jgi:hypothetical protein
MDKHQQLSSLAKPSGQRQQNPLAFIFAFPYIPEWDENMILPVMSALNIKNITLRGKCVHAKFHARIWSMVIIHCIIKRVSRHVEVVEMRPLLRHLLPLRSSIDHCGSRCKGWLGPPLILTAIESSKMIYRGVQKSAVNINSLETIRISCYCCFSHSFPDLEIMKTILVIFYTDFRANGIYTYASGVRSSVEVQANHRVVWLLLFRIWAGLGSILGPEVTHPDSASTSGSLGTDIILENRSRPSPAPFTFALTFDAVIWNL